MRGELGAQSITAFHSYFVGHVSHFLGRSVYNML